MSFQDDLDAVQAEWHKGPRCSVYRILEGMAPTDKAAFQRTLDDTEILPSIITAALVRRGVKVREDTIRRHRRGACSCP